VVTIMVLALFAVLFLAVSARKMAGRVAFNPRTRYYNSDF
jgi:hypothetical protein